MFFLRNIFIDIEFPVYLYYLCFLSVFMISILKGGIKLDKTMLYFVYWVIIVYTVVISFIGYLLSISSFSGISGFNGLVNHSLLLGFMFGVFTIICFVNYLFLKK